MTEKEIGCDNCYYTYFDEKAYPCSLCIRGIERTDMWQPSKKTKATISKMEQVDKDINVRSKTMRDCYNCERYENDCECVECDFEPKTEPQTDLLVTEYPQDGEVNLIGRDKTEAVVMAYDVYKELTEPQIDCRRCIHFTTDKCRECFGKELFIDSGYITKLEQPETDCSWK